MSLEKPGTSAQTRQLVSTDTLETLKKLASTQELCRDLSIGITLPNGVTYNDMGELIGGEFYEQLKKLSTENLCDISNDINDLPDVDILTTQFNPLKSFQLQSDAEEKLRLQVGKITRMILDYNPSILNTVDTVPQVQGSTNADLSAIPDGMVSRKQDVTDLQKKLLGILVTGILVEDIVNNKYPLMKD